MGRGVGKQERHPPPPPRRMPYPPGTFAFQPSVRFAEDTLVRSEDDEEEEERRFLAGKQRLIRKDTPHYKKHFRIAQLPRPEAVVALLQGLSADGGPSAVGEEEEEPPPNNGWEDEEPHDEGPAAPPSVKVGSWPLGAGSGGRQSCLPASQACPPLPGLCPPFCGSSLLPPSRLMGAFPKAAGQPASRLLLGLSHAGVDRKWIGCCVSGRLGHGCSVPSFLPGQGSLL